MIKNIFFILIIFVVWLAFIYEEKGPEDPFAVSENASEQDFSFLDFECEGKKDCSEMISCAEAKYYVRKCPGTNLDPDGDGVPCESLCTNN